mmetsp:Transcript_10902/g.21095  ORF Transcript_10902/g.21095 Transcript_10902/m.21095 type:complete len:203 (-) Transcript_10902:444-1052(-)
MSTHFFRILPKTKSPPSSRSKPPRSTEQFPQKRGEGEETSSIKSSSSTTPSCLLPSLSLRSCPSLSLHSLALPYPRSCRRPVSTRNSDSPTPRNEGGPVSPSRTELLDSCPSPWYHCPCCRCRMRWRKNFVGPVARSFRRGVHSSHERLSKACPQSSVGRSSSSALLPGSSEVPPRPGPFEETVEVTGSPQFLQENWRRRCD